MVVYYSSGGKEKDAIKELKKAEEAFGTEALTPARKKLDWMLERRNAAAGIEQSKLYISTEQFQRAQLVLARDSGRARRAALARSAQSPALA